MYEHLTLELKYQHNDAYNLINLTLEKKVVIILVPLMVYGGKHNFKKTNFAQLKTLWGCYNVSLLKWPGYKLRELLGRLLA